MSPTPHAPDGNDLYSTLTKALRGTQGIDWHVRYLLNDSTSRHEWLIVVIEKTDPEKAPVFLERFSGRKNYAHFGDMTRKMTGAAVKRMQAMATRHEARGDHKYSEELAKFTEVTEALFASHLAVLTRRIRGCKAEMDAAMGRRPKGTAPVVPETLQ